MWSFSPMYTTSRSGSGDNTIWTDCNTAGLGLFDLPEVDPGFEDSDEWHISWHVAENELYPPSNETLGSDNIYPEYRTVSVRSCLSEPYSAPCKVFASGPFLLISLLCVLFGSLLSVLVSSFHWRKESCQCLGDDLKVFMTHGPDIARTSGTEPMVWKGTKKRWGQVVSRRMWLWTYIPIGVFLVGGTIVLCVFGSSSLQ